jgi:hypothetical protein
MTETRRIWLGMAIPGSFKEVLARSLMTALVAFVALLIWDFVESADFDPAGIFGNAMAVGVGWLVLDALLMVTLRGKS